MNNKKNITIFGATGKIGGDLIRLFSDAAISVIAVTRDLRKAISLPFVEWVQADMAHPAELISAICSGGGVFLTAGPGPNFVEEQNNVIQAAKKVGAAHIVKISSGEADAFSPLFIPRMHGKVERTLQKSGVPYTILRLNGLMQNWLGELAESVRKERKFYEATGDGKRAYLDRRDVAEVAFKCLTAAENHYGENYFLTGGKAVNYFEIADVLSHTIGEVVEYISISPEEVRREMERQGMPFALIETFVAYDVAQRNGEKASVTDCVNRLLGRPPRTIADFFADHRESFL